MAANIKSVPLSYSLAWISAGWRVTRFQYGLALLATLIFCGFHAGITYGLDWLGASKIAVSIASSLVVSFFLPGMMTMCHYWARAEKISIGQLFKALNDFEVLKQFLPMIFLGLLSSVASVEITASAATNPMVWWWMAPIGIFSFLTQFITPQIVITKTHFLTALGNSLEATVKNLIQLIAFLLCYTLFALLMGIFILPIFFVLLPAMIPLCYCVYASCLEGIDPNQILPKPIPAPILP